MKKITLLLNLMLVTLAIQAQNCPEATLPYSESFDNTNSTNIPPCTTQQLVTGSAWDVAPAPADGYSGSVLRYQASDQQANSWFYSKAIYLNAGSYYKLNYLFGNDSFTTFESFAVALATYPNPGATYTILEQHYTVTGASVSHSSIPSFTVSQSGTYYIGINATSQANQGQLYIDDLTISELICPNPTSVRVAGLSESAATISWTRPADMPSPNGYYYAWSISNTLPESSTFTNQTSIYLSNLTPDTEYYFFVRSECNQGSGEWSEGFAFTTSQCDAADLPYTLNFEYLTFPELPLCTSIETISGNDWVTQQSYNSDLGGILKYNGNDEDANAWFFTRPVDLVAGQYYKINYGFTTSTDSASQDFKITIGSNPSSQAALITVAEHTDVTNTSMQYAMTSAISVPQTGRYYVGINVTSAANHGNLFLDNIIIDNWGVCERPMQSRVSNTSDTSALVSWMNSWSIDIASGYTYAYSTTNSIPLNGTFTAENNIQLTNLEPNTTYYFFVRTNCGPVESDWNSFLTFKTAPCTAVNLPYAIDFEAYTAPAFDDCLTLVGNTEYMPYVENNPGYGFTNNTFTFPAAVDVNGGLQLISRGVYLDSGKYYRVSYRYGTNNTNGTGSLDVWMYDNYNIANLNSVAFRVGSHYHIEGNTQNTRIINTVRPQQSGIQYFTFKGYGNYGEDKIFVDDFQVEELYCEEPTLPALSPVNTNSVSISWNAPELITEGVAYRYQYYNSTSDTPPSEGTNTSNTTVRLNNLIPNNVYYLFVRTSVDQTVFSDWITIPYTTTGILNTIDTITKAVVVYPNPVKDILNINGADIINNIELYNVTGQLVYRANTNAKDATVNMENFPAGVYMLTLYSNGAVKKQTIVKQ